MEVLKCKGCGGDVKRTKSQIAKAKWKGYENVFCNNSCQGKYKSKLVREEILNKGVQICSLCKEEKELSYFNKNKSKPSGYNTVCRDCSKERSKKYYKDNPRKHRKNVTKRRQEKLLNLRLKVIEYLSEHPCVDCGEEDFIVLQFDHRDPETKSHNVSFLLSRLYKWETIKKEIDKCDVRCANCHTRRTAKQFNWYSNLNNNNYEKNLVSN